MPKGTYKLNSKNAARITVAGRSVHLGTFDTEVEAGEVYDTACMVLGRGLSAYNSVHTPISQGQFQRIASVLLTKNAITPERLEELGKLTWQ